MDQHVTRRSLLAGAGAAAAAAAIGTGVASASASPVARQGAGDGSNPLEGGIARGLGTAGSGLAAAALTPGLTYQTIDGGMFFPSDPSATPRDVGTGPGATTTAGNALIAGIPIPVGVVLKEVTVFYLATTAPTPVMIVFKKPLDGDYGLLVPAAPLPLDANITSVMFNVNDAVDGTATYLADSPVNAAGQTVCAVRVGYEAPPAYVAISPMNRVLDTRTSGGKLGADEERVVDLQVPGLATAAVINLTITETEVAGFVAVFPADVGYAGNSNINWSASEQNLANSVITDVDPTGKIKIRGGVNPTHVVIDVQGYLL